MLLLMLFKCLVFRLWATYSRETVPTLLRFYNCTIILTYAVVFPLQLHNNSNALQLHNNSNAEG